MASNKGFETNGDIEASGETGRPNEVNDNHATDDSRNQTKEVLELNYKNSKHSAICSIVVFLALIVILGAILFVLIFFLQPTDDLSSQPDIEMQVEVKGQYAVEVSIRIQNLDFKDSLSDRSSKEYTDLEDQVKFTVSSAISGTDLRDKYAELEITNIRSGSVIVDFAIVLCDPFMTEDDILQTVEEALKTINSNNDTKNNLQIDNSQLSVTAAPDDLKLRGRYCEPLRPTVSPTETPTVPPVAENSSSLSPTPSLSQITPTMSSVGVTPTPSSQTITPTVAPTSSSSFVSAEVPGTSTRVSHSTTKVLMSSTLIETSGSRTTPSLTTALPGTSTKIITTPLMTSSITSITSSKLLSSTATPSLSASVGIGSTPSTILTSTSSILLSTTMPVSVFPTVSSMHDISMTSSLSISSQSPTSMPSISSSATISSVQPTATTSRTLTMTSPTVIPPQSSTDVSPSATLFTMSTYSSSIRSHPMTPSPTTSVTYSSMLASSVSQMSPSVLPTPIPSVSTTLVSRSFTSMTTPSLASTSIDIRPTSSLIMSNSLLSPFTTMSAVPSAVFSSLSQTSTPVVSMTTPLLPSSSSPTVSPSSTSTSSATSHSTFVSQGTSMLPQSSTPVILPTPLPSTTMQPESTTMTNLISETTDIVTSPSLSPPVDTTVIKTESSSLSPSDSTYQSSSEEPTTSPSQTSSAVPFLTSFEDPTTQNTNTTPSIKTTVGFSVGEVSTSVTTVPLTVCAESSRLFNPSTYFNSSDVLEGTLVNLECSWTYIVAVPEARIQVQFLDFDVGNDVLEIDLSDSRTVTYSGSNIPPDLITNAHMIRFTLKTDLQANPIKFSIFLQMILPENLVTALVPIGSTTVAHTAPLPGCSSGSAQLLTPNGPPRTITSPGYPRGYLTNLECTWQFILFGQGQERILLEFVAFNLGDDILQITSSDTSFTDRQLTGSQLPAPISTSASPLLLKFISDDADTATGFEVTIQVIEPTTQCLPSHMFVNSEQSRVVTSPDYPSGYGANLACSWTLQTTVPNSQMILTFLTFDLSDDLLQVIFQGNVLQFSGSLLPMPITITNDRVELQFTSNGEHQGSGFELVVSVHVPIVTTPFASQVITTVAQPSETPVVPDLQCTSSSVLLTAESDPKTFNSPGYPSHNYSTESGCSWSFTVVDATKVLRLHFVSFDVGGDEVRVDYGARTSKTLSGSTLPEDITTVGSMLSVQLVTSVNSNYPGFQAIVTVEDR